MKWLKKALRITAWILILMLLYALVMFILSRITVGQPTELDQQDVDIYIRSNGVHTDLVMPLVTPYRDWRDYVRPQDGNTDYTHDFVGFGWGDREFYLNTPSWAELDIITALQAVSYTGESIIHTTFIRNINESDRCVRIPISVNQYKDLIRFIDAHFKPDAAGRPLMIPGSAYGSDDSFYEAKGKYSLVYTCNSWANEGLKAAGQKAALWTLTDTGILVHYRD